MLKLKYLIGGEAEFIVLLEKSIITTNGMVVLKANHCLWEHIIILLIKTTAQIYKLEPLLLLDKLNL